MREPDNKNPQADTFDPRKPILLIHGIQSDGRWQAEVALALNWFFRPVHVQYSHFRYLGPLLVMSEPFILAPGVLLIIAGAWMGKYLLLGGVFLILFSFSKFALSFRRGNALAKYHRISGDDLKGRPHVIAHSFGTYLTGRLLREVDAAKVSRVVLAGCVMPRFFDWTNLLEQKKIEAIRNDYSPNDWVAGFAGFAGLIHEDLGPAGKYGFGGASVHHLANPNHICEKCQEGSIALVHDVRCENIAHSGAFVSRAHTAAYWLPFFWEIDAGEYDELTRFCQRYVNAIESADTSRLPPLENEARTKNCRWLGGITLWEALARRATEELGVVNDALTGRALTQFCFGMTYASFDGFKNKISTLLHPRNAMSKAIAAVREGLE